MDSAGTRIPSLSVKLPGQVSPDDLGQGAHGEPIVTGDAAPRPCLGWHIPEENAALNVDIAAYA